MSRWGLVAVCGAGLALSALLLVRERNGSEVTQAGASTAAGREPDSPTDELREPARAPLALPRNSLLAARRESRLDALPRGTLFGRLVEAESRAALAVERIVLLASPDNSVAETLRSRADGSFTGTRDFPRGSVRAWIKDPASGELLVRHEAEFDPERAGEWLVPVPSAAPAQPARGEEPAKERAEEGTTVRGRVLDLAALPVANAVVKVFPLGAPGEVRHGDTDSSGEFTLPLVPGAHRLIVQGRFATSTALLVAAQGANDAGVILLPAAASAGDLRGRLVADSDEGDPFAFLVLRELASGRELGATSDWELFAGEKDGISAFAIKGVPPGEYELEVVGLDGREYEPESLRVSPPAEGLEFRARGPAPVGVVFVARDELSGQPVESFLLLVRIHGQWVGDLGSEAPSRAFDRWAVHADGYRPAQGDFTGARVVRDEEGREHLELEVALGRGLGGAVLFKDLESDRLVAPGFEGFLDPGLDDVQVLADGQVVARSDPSGLAVFVLARAPERLEFVRPGWRVASDRVDEGVRVVFLARE
ncbi:MAG: hypothetical protein HOP15_12965 [Planctomycetes bacterium]|nr:hypothetical protein [Planctomycetota bacterium]